MHEALWVPRRARELPEGSLERAYASLGLRQLWHMLYDPCPLLPAEAFEPFCEWALLHGVSLDWTFHLSLRGWLEAPGPELVQELAAAAASRWTLSDQTAARGIMLVDPCLPGRAVVGWKSRSLAEGKRVVAATPETLAMLQKDAGALEQNLRDSGLKTSSDSLSFMLREQAREGGQQGEGRRGGHGRGHEGPDGTMGAADLRAAQAASNARVASSSPWFCGPWQAIFNAPRRLPSAAQRARSQPRSRP